MIVIFTILILMLLWMALVLMLLIIKSLGTGFVIKYLSHTYISYFDMIYTDDERERWSRPKPDY